jgi:archaellum component FlaG (FlaF/FlaG flagellin family)
MGSIWKAIFGWEEVLVTYDINLYMKTKNEYNNSGIATQSEFVNNPNSHRGFGSVNQTTMYYLYVKKDKKHRTKE